MLFRSALQQGLRCRAALVAIKDRDQRILLCRYAEQHPLYPGLWDISSFGYPYPGESCLDAALRITSSRFLQANKELLLVTRVPASPATANRELALFQNRPERFYPQVRPDGDITHTMSIDEDELAALLREMPELIAPTLRMIAGYVFSATHGAM